MSLPPFTKDMGIISALDDEPNDMQGLSADALKAKFDEGGQALKEYINEEMLPGVEQAIQDAEVAAGNVPSGGTTGQVLAKRSNNDRDAEWVHMVPSGGTTGQVLAKRSNNDRDMKWQNGVPAGGNAGNFLTKKSGTSLDTQWINVADYVIETGRESAWTYEKWASGKCIARYTGSLYGLEFSTAVGSVYRTEAETVKLPASMKTVSFAVISSSTSKRATQDTYNIPWASFWRIGSDLKYALYRGTSGTEWNNIHVYIEAVGMWK